MAPSRARVLVGERWSVVLSAQDCEFVAKHDDLEVLRVSRAQSQACQRGEEPVQNATHATPGSGASHPFSAPRSSSATHAGCSASCLVSAHDRIFGHPQVAARTAAINRLHGDLEKIRCGYHTHTAALTSPRGLDAATKLLRGDTGPRAEIARDRVRQIRQLNRQVDALSTRFVEAVTHSGTTLTDIYGIGPIGAADIIAEVGDPARFETKARFAMANGTAPLQASSGRVRRHRLNRGGNRQLNKAIHTAAIAQISRPGTEGRAYYQRCLDRGKTKREAIRALKRRISDRVWTHLQADLQHPKPAHCLT